MPIAAVRRKRLLLFAAAVLLVLIGSSMVSLGAARTVTSRYAVLVEALPGVAWTVWVPRPDEPMTVETTSGIVERMETVDTPFGRMDSLSGNGTVYVRWAAFRTWYGLESPRQDVEGASFLGLSGWDGTSFHAWRNSTDPASNMFVGGGAWINSSRMDESADRFWGGYSRGVDEGWNVLVAHRQSEQLTSSSLPVLVESGGVALLIASGGLLFVIGRRRKQIE